MALLDDPEEVDEPDEVDDPEDADPLDDEAAPVDVPPELVVVLLVDVDPVVVLLVDAPAPTGSFVVREPLPPERASFR